MAIHSSMIDKAAEDLRAIVATIVAAFPGRDWTVVRDLRLDCDPQAPGRSVRWEYAVRTPVPPDALRTVERVVLPMMGRDGWRVTDRSSAREHAFQFARDGWYLGINYTRDGSGDVVVGGSSHCVSA